jgi:hypothetical protein
MEECARNMACEHNGEVVSQEDYRELMTEMGEVGQDAIKNIRIIKEKPIKSTAVDTDKAYQVFDSQSGAIDFAATTLRHKLNVRSSLNAPVALQTNGENPTCDELLNRMWGLSDTTRVRMVPTIDKK